MRKAYLLFALLCVTFSACRKVTSDGPTTYIINGVHDVTIQQGQDDMLTLDVSYTGPIQENVTLSIWGLPAGVTADVNPTTGTPNFTATAVFTDHYGVPGNYTVKVLAHGSQTGDRYYTFNLKILTPANCGLLGFYSQGTTGCGGGTTYAYTETVTNSTAASNRVIFANFADMSYQVYADINCANSTMTIPNQLLPNGITVAGSGTFTSNVINVNYSTTTPANITTYCNFTLIR